MFFGKKKPAKPILVLQAAQLTGLTQALALLSRIRITATEEEKEDFACGESFKLLDFYSVRLVQMETFEHIDNERAKGCFCFWTPRLYVEIEVSVKRESFVVQRRSPDGFQEKNTHEHWKPVQGNVWAHHILINGKPSSFPNRSATQIRDTELTSAEDLVLKLIEYGYE